MSAVYRFDMEMRRVYVTAFDGSNIGSVERSLDFDTLRKTRSADIVSGAGNEEFNWWEWVPEERRIAYAIARDELIERGIIQESA